MKKAAIAAIVAAAGAAVLFLSQTVIKYNNSGKKCIHINEHIEAFPYADAVIPDEFTDYTIQGISLKAPDCLVPQIPEGKEDSEAVRYISEDKEKYDLQILVMPEKIKPEYPNWNKLGEDGFFKSSAVRKSVEKMGYSVPQNHYDLMFLLGTADIRTCNKFSLSEVSAFSKIARYKEIMYPAVIGINDSDDKLETPLEVEEHKFYYENSDDKMFITQSASKGGRYSLAVECYSADDLDSHKVLVIMSAEPDLAQKIVKTVHYAEE